MPNIFTPGTLLYSQTIRNVGEEVTGQMYVIIPLIENPLSCGVD